jgi:AcrR family transcriptional regulator
MSTRGRAPSKQAAPDGLTPARNGFGAERNGLRREQVSEIQRARLLAAMAEVCAERGAANVTVAHVVERAGVSRRTFYEIFTDREDCFLAAFDEGIARASRYVLDAYDPSARWAERIRSALTALLEFLDVERGVGWLLIVGSLGAGTHALERRRRVLAQIITVVDEGRTEAKAGAQPPPLTAEGAVGAVFSVIHARLLERNADAGRVSACPRMGELVNPLMSMVVLPYLGSAAARRELDRPVPRAERRSLSDGASNPLKELEMRLTYRTVRVLMAVAASPGASNRTVADRAGIGDQGQISKLLSRLEKLGLVSNTGLGPGRGAPNAWMLTGQGEEVNGALAAQTSHA